MGIKIAQRTTFLQDKFRLSESATLIGFEFQFIDVVSFARFRVNIILH